MLSDGTDQLSITADGQPIYIQLRTNTLHGAGHKEPEGVSVRQINSAIGHNYGYEHYSAVTHGFSEDLQNRLLSSKTIWPKSRCFAQPIVITIPLFFKTAP